ncbi:hypothetical protein BDV12DRAFT_203613 [Aspergillus spectabilis]
MSLEPSMDPNRANAAASTTNTHMNPAFTAQVVNPSQFSWWKKFHVVAAGTYFVFNTSLGTSLPSGAKGKLAMAFQFSTDDMRLILPTSLYMVRFAFGPLSFGPLSEYLGRKPILLVTCAIYLIFTMGCALAPNFPALLVFHLIAGERCPRWTIHRHLCEPSPPWYGNVVVHLHSDHPVHSWTGNIWICGYCIMEMVGLDWSDYRRSCAATVVDHAGDILPCIGPIT